MGMGMRWEQKGLSSLSLLMLLLLQLLLLQLLEVEGGVFQRLGFESIGAENSAWATREFIEGRSVVVEKKIKREKVVPC